MSTKIGIRAWIDFAFKKIFGKPGNEICLIGLLNSILELTHSIVSVVILNPFSFKDFDDDKLVCVDVKATDQNGRVFIVEVQIVVHDSLAQRALYYGCKGYSDQLQSGHGYSQLKATYSVCLLMRNLWNDGRLHHHYRLVERTTGEVLPNSIEIHTIELSKYNGTSTTVSASNELEQWCYWIRYSHEHTAEELQKLLPGLPFLRATAELKDIQMKTEEREMYDLRQKAILDYESNLIDARQEGRQEGRREGRQEAELKGEIKLICTLQSILGIPQSTDAELSGKSLAELQSKTELLQKQILNRQM